MPTSFSDFADLCRSIESTAKRTEKVAYLVAFLKTLERNEVVPAVSFTTGRPFSESDERVLDVGGQTMWKVHRSSRQSSLIHRPVTLLEVYHTFEKISQAAGAGSRQRKETLLNTLLSRLTRTESDYLMRIVFGEMRIGAVEGVVLDAIAEAATIDRDKLRRANMLLGSLPRVAELALTNGRAVVENVGLTLFVPIKPMLANIANAVSEILKEYGGRCAFEFKYDGARIQIHKRAETVKIFSRRLTDVTASVPDIVHVARTRILVDECLVEGEVVAVGRDGRPLPFQDLMRRFRRVHEVESMTKSIPLQLFLFDVIYLNGKLLIDDPYRERWGVLSSITDQELLAERIVTDDPSEAKQLMDEAIRAGHEGLMAKQLGSTYTPGVRGKKWLKLKPADTLDLVIVAADWGSGRRKGWLSNYHLGVRDALSGEFLVVGKTFKGLTDQEFSDITPKLLSLKTKETEYTVYVKPEIVVEVTFNEIQHSPHYKSEFALRFARITRFRSDKSPQDADTIQRLSKLYQDQFMYKSPIDL